MNLGSQFEQLQLFPTGPSIPAAQPAEEPTKGAESVEERIKRLHPDAVAAVEAAPKTFKYKGPALYHGSSADLGVGDIIYPTGVDLRPMGGSGGGADLVGDPERFGVRTAYATPDYEEAADYTNMNGGETGISLSRQGRLFHTVLQVEPLGKIKSRPMATLDLSRPHGTEEVLSPHGFKVTGVAGYVASSDALPEIKGESNADRKQRAQLTPRINSVQFADETPSGTPSWFKQYGQSQGMTSLEKAAMGRRTADSQYNERFDKLYDKVSEKPDYVAPRATYDKLDELYNKANPEDEEGPHFTYSEIHGEMPPWAEEE